MSRFDRGQSSMERQQLVEDFGLKPRDIAAAWPSRTS